ncbi:hypothetical protein [Methanoculleus receptaculi]|jgi:hypothetical protein|uniref:DUF4388 domain-containing protein n=1 Tax=Methanoculleus receptaculi TaxID=394967 RepID=A0AAX4FWC3_9EURY|nr:hypothetical protein [Methanoculleus receptaculi]WOX58258.1 hypothetical protein R6Y96_03180 [Methanoculleus receptaculi]
MQLPRGRFHKIIKSTATPALIEEMRAAKFTGICRIVLGSESATLVLNEGSVVLAEYGGLNGYQALDGVLGSEEEAGAELNLLTPEQVRLSQEFNRQCAIEVPTTGKVGKSPAKRGVPEGAEPAAPGKQPAGGGISRDVKPVTDVKPAKPPKAGTVPERSDTAPGVGKSSSAHSPEPTAGSQSVPRPGAKPAQEVAGTSQSGGDEIDTLLQNMEEINIEHLVSNFRTNCKEMLKKIHLDHLIKDNET